MTDLTVSTYLQVLQDFRACISHIAELEGNQTGTHFQPWTAPANTVRWMVRQLDAGSHSFAGDKELENWARSQ